MAVIIVVFLAFSMPPYLSLDPSQSRVPQPPGFTSHYWFLSAHVLFGSIAMISALLQIWPWFRAKYPAVHRKLGRVYVFAGVLPAGAMALTVGALSPFGPATRVANVVAGVLWLGCTFAGWHAARQRRFADHRRWMVRSFALTMSIIVSRVTGPIALITLQPQLETTFGGSELALTQSVAAISAWVSTTLVLFAAQWHLDRRPARKKPATAR
ncbi:hypothetical protein DMC61_31990 [Amycolatopsis sp. WAC 04169]|uniref:DUF2306 domain-containing protein n=1 Tax=Amycolatopsis sp. WAC 04169 TaxID=2203197 RepID=UPI000F7BA336|nr:DUF2306 domain-containing protein [Amycolatopsis sp. WAC 04169]RSN23325.1 hypothetical protein DMC61_31990 [Amycolatopsis sp. WAC 04169]